MTNKEHVHAIDTFTERVQKSEKNEHEPMAWIHNFIDGGFTKSRPTDLDRHPDRWTPLYKDPTPCKTCESSHDTRKEWVGLTEAERIDILDAELTTQSTEHFALAQAIEAKLKEKNA